jgi:hypothetical protein
MHDRQQGVVHAHPNRGAGRRLYGLWLTFTPGWPEYAIELPLGRIASMPATGQLQTVSPAVQIARKLPFTLPAGLIEGRMR